MLRGGMAMLGKKRAELPFRAYNGSEPFVFISYAHADSAVVFPIIKELNDRGVYMWYDEGIEIGSEWPQAIAERIMNCRRFMLFISHSSIRSNNVRQEVNFANSKHKNIVPIYLKHVKLNAGLEMILSVFQATYLDAYKNNIEGFYKDMYKALTEDMDNARSAVTIMGGAHTGGAFLRLDKNGDKALPASVRLPESGRFTIGRFDVSLGIQQSDFEFSHEVRYVSRKHASFEHSVGGYTVTDLGSKAGTWINGYIFAPLLFSFLRCLGFWPTANWK